MDIADLLILSHNLDFSHDAERDDRLIDGDDDTSESVVRMELANDRNQGNGRGRAGDERSRLFDHRVLI